MCTIDFDGIVLFNRDTSQKIESPGFPSPQCAATLKNDFVVQYEKNCHQHIGLLSETGKLLSSLQISLVGIRAMCSDDKEDLLFVVKDGSVMKRLHLFRL
jgi:hypothetical protein